MTNDASANEIRHCAHCGHNGGFDGMGDEVRERQLIDSTGTKTTVVETRYRVHCGQCGCEFLIVVDKDER